MTTHKRVNGDYEITALNGGEITLATDVVRVPTGDILVPLGNVDANNISALTSISAANINLTGDISIANIQASGNIEASGNVSGNYFIGDGSLLTNVTAVSNVAVTQIANANTIFAVQGINGPIITQIDGVSNIMVITSSGITMSGTTVATDLVANSIRSDDSAYVQIVDGLQVQNDIETLGSLLAVGNISGNYVLGNGALLTGVITSVANINNGTSNVSIEVADGNIAAGVNGVANVLVITEQGLDVTSNVSAANVNATSISGTITTAAQTNITSLGTLTSLTVNGLATHTGNIDVTGNINVTGNLDYTNVNDLVVGDPLIYIGANNTGNLLDLGFVVAYDDGLYQHGGLVRDHTDGVWKLFGNVEAEPTTTIDWGNAIYQPLEVGNITVGNIINQNANGVGNIGSLGGYFNTVFATATSAQYADLAELYLADSNYEPGTVMSFGGDAEVTMCDLSNDHKIAGVVSDRPAYVMNAGLSGEHATKIALMGRVPCLVRGPVQAGDILVGAPGGWAEVNNQAAAGRILGKSLVSCSHDSMIEIVVGKT